MDKIKNSILRTGNFTSSEIYRLMAEPTAKAAKEGAIFGAPALEYIAECNMERRLQRSLSDTSNARPLTWGKLCEQRVFNVLGLDYVPGFDDTIQHPSIPFWCGSPDATKDTDMRLQDGGATVGEVKCPLSLKSFCQLVDCNTIEEVRENHKDGEKFYWQIVSNAILTNSKYAELIVYLPYLHELDAIRDMASDVDGFTQNQFAWIGFASNDELPYLIDGGYYENLNIIRFEVAESHKDKLTARVLEAGKMLEQVKELETV